MYAVASLDEGMEWAADTFGAPAAYGGEHVDLGTRNALLSLGSTYLGIWTPPGGKPSLTGWTLGSIEQPSCEFISAANPTT